MVVGSVPTPFILHHAKGIPSPAGCPTITAVLDLTAALLCFC